MPVLANSVVLTSPRLNESEALYIATDKQSNAVDLLTSHCCQAVERLCEQLPQYKRLHYQMDAGYLKETLRAYLALNPSHSDAHHLNTQLAAEMVLIEHHDLSVQIGRHAKNSYVQIEALKDKGSQLLLSQQVSLRGGVLQNKYGYCPQTSQMELLERKRETPYVVQELDKWRYSDETHRMEHVEATINEANGKAQHYVYDYVPAIKRFDKVQTRFKDLHSKESVRSYSYIAGDQPIRVKQGQNMRLNGDLCSGTVQYIPELNRMEFVNGTRQQSNGNVLRGIWWLCSPLDAMIHTPAVHTKNPTFVENGEWGKVPELNDRVYLLSGERKMQNGETHVGHFGFVAGLSSVDNNTHLLKGEVRHESGLVEQVDRAAIHA